MRFTHSLATPLLLVSSLTTRALSVAVKRQSGDRTNVVSNSKISDPVAECAPYWFPPWDSYSKNFPATWSTAKLVSGDSAALAKYNEIKDKIPVIAPKVTGQTYDYANDPDCWWTATTCVKPKLAGIPADIAKVPEPLSIGYGFDDGPNCSHNAFYDFLQKNNQKATMFFIGSNVVNWPLEAQRALYDGHEMCAHSWSHASMTQLTNEQAFAEIYYSENSTIPVQAIKVITGVTPTCFRPPYGDTDDRIRFIVNALGLTTLLWQYDSNDWKGGDQVDQNYQTFVNRATAGEFNSIGSIFLQHETSEFTMNTAMKWYPTMKSAFAHLVPVAVALNKTRPYLETNVEFPTFDEYILGTIQKPLPASALSYLSVTATSASTSSTATSSSAPASSTSRASSSAASSAASSTTASSSARTSSTPASSTATSTSASRSSSASGASSRSGSSTAASSTTGSSTTSPSSTATANLSSPPTLSATPTQAEWGVAFTWMKSYMDSLMSKWKW